MKKWIVLLLMVALLLVGLTVAGVPPLVVAWGRISGQQFFRGWPTGLWRRALAADPVRREEALAQFESGGTEAVAVLAELLQDTRYSSAEVRWTAADMLGKVGASNPVAAVAILGAMRDPDPHVRNVAAAAMPKAGVVPDAGVPALIKLIGEDRQPVPLRALSEYRSAAHPALTLLAEILANRELDEETRWNAARTIGKVGPTATAAIPALVAALQDEAATVREHAAEALGDIGPNAGEAVGALASVLTDRATRVRRDAVRSLGQIGATARPAVPEIKRLLHDPEPVVRKAAEETLRAIAPEELPAPATKGTKPIPAGKD